MIYNYEINISLIFLYIIIDFFGLLNIWSENFYRRIIHHIQGHVYNNKKIPWIIFPEIKLSNNEIKIIKEISDSREKKNAVNTLTKYMTNFGIAPHYSKRSSLYYNDFNNEAQDKLDIIGNNIKNSIEKEIKKKLFLGTSNFRSCILRYEGRDSNFKFHYDREETNCFRCLFLFHKKGNISPFCYYDVSGNKQKKYFNIGEGLFFRGTTTYHGVEENTDPDSERYIVGWQYSTDLSVKSTSFCSELRDQNFLYILKIGFYYLGMCNLLNYSWTKYVINIPVNFNIIFSNTILISIFGIYLSKYLPKNIGTGLYFDISKNFVFILFCLMSSINSLQDGLLLFCYLQLTEMFMPNYIIGKTLK